jgi:phosphotransacetylase
LSLYSEELKEFIEEKKKKQAELQLQREQEIASGKVPATTATGLINGLISRYEDMMKMSGSIFQTQKVVSNNSNLKPGMPGSFVGGDSAMGKNDDEKDTLDHEKD